MGKNPSFRCSDQFDRNLELATEASEADNKSEFIREALKETIVGNAGAILDHHDDVESLTWE